MLQYQMNRQIGEKKECEPLNDSERQKILVEWNQTRQEYPRHACLHPLFEAQTVQTPNALAVVCQGERLTYDQLNTRANQLAHILRLKGVGPNSLVGIHVGRSPGFVIALLGILKAGGAYVPLDPEYPAKRLAFMIEDAEAKVIVCDSDLPPDLKCDHCEVVSLPLSLNDSPDRFENPVSVNGPDDLAYVMFTSGSTGLPKGVCMPHRQLLNLIHWQNSRSLCGKGARTLQFAPLGFDVCFQEIFSTLSCGGTLVITSQPERKDFTSLLRLIEDLEINRLFLPFVALDHLAGVVDGSDWNLKSVREVITAGEQLRVTPAIRRFFQKRNGARLINQYGPTEAHVVSAYELGGNPADWPFWPPIGKPIANTQLYILDAELEPVPVGVAGDLYIGGAQVAQGYLKRPELTAEKFIPDPFSRTPEARLYRTDDSAKFLPDGNIEFLGRTDNQVKIRGFRVEPGEIEAALLAHPLVRGAVVMAHADAAGDKYLAAYVVPAAAQPPSASELRSHLKTKVPDYMVPTVFSALPEFPLTPNGKVDGRALQDSAVELSTGSDYVAPKTEMECQLAQIWSELLQQKVGLHDNFFELGGYSLLAIRTVTQINQAMGLDLVAVTLYQHPTIHELAGVLHTQGAQTGGAKFITVRPGAGGRTVVFLNPPLEFVQIANQMRGKDGFYISEVPFSKPLVAAALRFDTSAFPTLAELAAPHVAHILRSGLRGPVNLAGFSYDAATAFEVAHELIKAGIPVEDVFLFDADMKPTRLDLLRFFAKNTRAKGLGYFWNIVRGRLLLRQQLREDMASARKSEATADVAVSNQEIPWNVYQRIWNHALRGYKPRRLASHGVLFRATTTIYNDIHDYDGCLGWSNLFAHGLDVVETPGDHFGMWIEPNVHDLRQAWERSLQKISRSATACLCSASPMLAAIGCSV